MNKPKLEPLELARAILAMADALPTARRMQLENAAAAIACTDALFRQELAGRMRGFRIQTIREMLS